MIDDSAFGAVPFLEESSPEILLGFGDFAGPLPMAALLVLASLLCGRCEGY
jgi:hypothetical protein